MVIEVRKLTKSWREGDSERCILSGVDFSADAGEFVAIGGPSGSGKSTFLNLLAGLDKPDSGIIHIAGTDIVPLSRDACACHRRKHIGIVFQFFNLIPTLTVLENLKLPLMLNGIQRTDAHIHRLLEEFGLAERRNAWPDTLSGGEQQRLATLRAAIHEPAVILADEPTGNLDRARGVAVTALLHSLATRGACVVMVTHSRQAAAVAGRHLKLVDGNLGAWDW